jgi:cell division protein FtsL
MIITPQNLQPNYFRKVSSNEQSLSSDVEKVRGIVVSILLCIYVIYSVILSYRTYKLQKRLKHQLNEINRQQKESIVQNHEIIELDKQIAQLYGQLIDITEKKNGKNTT